MLTVCPKCTLTLAVTAADLRIGQGYVRCGRCATVFNALLALSDASTLELPGTALGGHSATATMKIRDTTGSAPAPAPVPEPAPAPPPTPEPQPPVPAPEPAPAPAPAPEAEQAGLEEPDLLISPSLAAEPLDMLLEQTSASRPTAIPADQTRDSAVAYAAGTEDAQKADVEIEVEIEAEEPALAPAAAAPSVASTDTAVGSAASRSDVPVDFDTGDDSQAEDATRRALEAEAQKAIASLDQTIGIASAPAQPDDAGKADSPQPVETRLSATHSVYVHDQQSLYAPRTRPEKPPPSMVLWGTYAALLALILGVQLLHYWRNDLAIRDDLVGRSLTRVYAILGLPLTPNWDLRDYDVRQLGAASNSGGDNSIRVQIRLTNHATHALPWPVLRLSLFDRYGKRVAARDLEPRDYLTREKSAALMPVAQQIESEVAVTNPGPDASSFELDVCVPAPHGLRCAGDSPFKATARP